MVQTLPDPRQRSWPTKKATTRSRRSLMPSPHEIDAAHSTLSNGKVIPSPRIHGYHEVSSNTHPSYSPSSNKVTAAPHRDKPLKRGYEYDPCKHSRAIDKVRLSESPDHRKPPTEDTILDTPKNYRADKVRLYESPNRRKPPTVDTL